MRFPSDKDMDVALLKSFEILHSKIGPSLDKIKDAKCRLLKLEYLEDKQSKGNFLRVLIYFWAPMTPFEPKIFGIAIFAKNNEPQWPPTIFFDQNIFLSPIGFCSFRFILKLKCLHSFKTILDISAVKASNFYRIEFIYALNQAIFEKIRLIKFA